ncbi:dimethylribityllumazine synthase [Flagelloscypha sp. PMI_526]|nr:dimethylribityllumazine synthase [Flagelloscypha sp. PMI_526]
MSTHNIKGLSASDERFDGSPLRIAIVHARWNTVVIDALLDGTIDALKKSGVKESNIVVQSVPGSFELPFGVSRVLQGSHVQASTGMTDLLGGLNFSSPKPGSSRTGTPALGQSSNSAASITMPGGPFDAIIAIGVLIKGSTMHFEYISEAVSTGLMRVQLDTGVPVIFGVLTCLTEDQALERAGIAGAAKNEGHNHGVDWGNAAVEMSSKAKRWSEGKFQ